MSESEYRTFKTVLPENFESQFSHIGNDDQYWKASDEFINNYPEYYRLSLQRVLYHEIQHAYQVGFNVNTRYTLSPEMNENPIISSTNKVSTKLNTLDFVKKLSKNFNISYRINKKNGRI